MSEFVIEACALRKSFGAHQVLRGLDLRVPSGSIFGFLGRNGAGKTTTIKILMGLMKLEGGTAKIFGLSTDNSKNGIKIRTRVGFVTEDKELYPYMTVEQLICFTRSFFPKWRDDLESRYLKVFDLPRNRKVPDLSKGMRSKLMLLLAISHGAELLILDEPTDGLDSAAVEGLLNELVSVSQAEGMTIFFSSHQLAEVEQIAQHVCIVDDGRAVASGSLADLKAQFHSNESHSPNLKEIFLEHVKKR